MAFFDLLGFSAWVKSDGSGEVFKYARGFLPLMVRASLVGSTVNADMSVNVANREVGYVHFSDSIILYSRDDTYSSLKTMLLTCGSLMNVVICGPSRMVRGAIAHGDFFADPPAGAYVGQALIDAYRLEGSQDWLALGLHENMEGLPYFGEVLREHQGYVVKALLPNSDSSRIPYCINWANERFLDASFDAMEGLRRCFRRSSASLQNGSAERTKLERRVQNTRDFLVHYNPDLAEEADLESS